MRLDPRPPSYGGHHSDPGYPRVRPGISLVRVINAKTCREDDVAGRGHPVPLGPCGRIKRIELPFHQLYRPFKLTCHICRHGSNDPLAGNGLSSGIIDRESSASVLFLRVAKPVVYKHGLVTD